MYNLLANGEPYLCPCSSIAVPLRPPMSHMMIEWSELPENNTLVTGSQHSAVTLPDIITTETKVPSSATPHYRAGFTEI